VERDDDDAPTDIDEEGDDPADGKTEFILVTSFEDDVENTGKVWVIPEDDEDEGYVLISGLDAPVGVCFDVNNEFLYVVDATLTSTGQIYQYEIEWDDDDDFQIANNVYTVIYQGPRARDCSVDEYGNLYFTTDSNEIHIVSYLDLWSGFTNQSNVIYNAESERISSPKGISVVDSEDIWFVNGADVETVGLLNLADAKTKFANSESIETKAVGVTVGYNVVASDDYVFFTSGDTVYAYDIDDEELKPKSRELHQPRGVAYGDDYLYVVDREDGTIYKIDAGDEDSELAENWIKITGAYGIFAVNSAGLLASVLLLLLY
jgi:hypothetical protein